MGKENAKKKRAKPNHFKGGNRRFDRSASQSQRQARKTPGGDHGSETVISQGFQRIWFRGSAFLLRRFLEISVNKYGASKRGSFRAKESGQWALPCMASAGEDDSSSTGMGKKEGVQSMIRFTFGSVPKMNLKNKKRMGSKLSAIIRWRSVARKRRTVHQPRQQFHGCSCDGKEERPGQGVVVILASDCSFFLFSPNNNKKQTEWTFSMKFMVITIRLEFFQIQGESISSDLLSLPWGTSLQWNGKRKLDGATK